MNTRIVVALVAGAAAIQGAAPVDKSPNPTLENPSVDRQKFVILIFAHVRGEVVRYVICIVRQPLMGQ